MGAGSEYDRRRIGTIVRCMGGLLVGAGLLLLLTGVVSRIGKLPRNHIAGFRTRTTMASSETWEAAHRAGGLFVAASGLAVTVLGLAVFFGANADVVSKVAVAVMVVCVIPGGIVAQRAAREVGNATEPS